MPNLESLSHTPSPCWGRTEQPGPGARMRCPRYTHAACSLSEATAPRGAIGRRDLFAPRARRSGHPAFSGPNGIRAQTHPMPERAPAGSVVRMRRARPRFALDTGEAGIDRTRAFRYMLVIHAASPCKAFAVVGPGVRRLGAESFDRRDSRQKPAASNCAGDSGETPAIVRPPTQCLRKAIRRRVPQHRAHVAQLCVFPV